MALYAFDGTWNAPDAVDDGVDRNTNVQKFLSFYAVRDASAQAALASYTPGVGTRFGKPGRIVGGFFGAGGRDRIDEMVESFRENWRSNAPESRVVDVIGFSRGAALALAFCNKLAAGVDIGGEMVRPPIRFLGLWDVVPSFGLPGVLVTDFHERNIGWELDVPSNVQHCFHAMALDERRGAFNVHRLDPELDDWPRIQEWWFRGVHSDVGGGNGNVTRGNIALVWMLDRAAECGLPIERDGVGALVCQNDAPVSHGARQGSELDRTVLKGDRIHPSAGKTLGVGETISVEVDSRLWFDWSGVLLSRGAGYRFRPDAQGRWTDKTIECTAAGWPGGVDHNNSVIEWFKSKALLSAPAGLAKRVPSANWFEMIASIGTDGKTTEAIGHGQHAETPWLAPDSGPLFFFPNDARLNGFGADFYENNHGSISVEVTRVS